MLTTSRTSTGKTVRRRMGRPGLQAYRTASCVGRRWLCLGVFRLASSVAANSRSSTKQAIDLRTAAANERNQKGAVPSCWVRYEYERSCSLPRDIYDTLTVELRQHLYEYSSGNRCINAVLRYTPKISPWESGYIS